MNTTTKTRGMMKKRKCRKKLQNSRTNMTNLKNMTNKTSMTNMKTKKRQKKSKSQVRKRMTREVNLHSSRNIFAKIPKIVKKSLDFLDRSVLTDCVTFRSIAKMMTSALTDFNVCQVKTFLIQFLIEQANSTFLRVRNPQKRVNV